MYSMILLYSHGYIWVYSPGAINEDLVALSS